MKLTASIAAMFLACATALAQVGDRDLLRHIDFSSQRITETPPAGANVPERALWTVRKQLTGRDLYEPANYMFLRPAVREIGFIPAVFATSDRILRDTRIGTVRAVPDPSDGRIHEGPEAYSLKRAAAPPPWARPLSGASPQAGPLPFREPKTLEGSGSAADERTAARWVSHEYDFVQYLIDNDLKTDARTLLFGNGFHASDTLTFLRGWTLYQLKELEAANSYLQAVPRQSAFYDQAFFYSNAVSAHLGDYDTPSARLQDYCGPYTELKGVQMAGLALLRDDPDAFKSAAGAFRYNDFALEAAEHELAEIFSMRYDTPQKSPWLAAAASAVVPGLGKIYAGQTGEGISSFLVIGAMGAITAEHWIKDGPRDWKTIVPGVLTAFLYLGNIYGSYMSVSIYNTRLNDAQDTAVLYNVHIPLRSVFK